MPAPARALQALLHGLIDYAGLFPPAAHNMADTVARYARYRLGPDAFALGRLVLPAARLMEWEQAVSALPHAERAGGPWRLTALVGSPVSRDIAAVIGFNTREAGNHDFQARVDSVEVKAGSPDDVRRIAEEIPPGLGVFYECPPDAALAGMLGEIAAAGGGAKIRTGGLVPTAVTPPGGVAAFIAGCVAASVPFKATAGLHHPVRAEYALTYEPDSPRTVMNGFLNVFVAAVLAHASGLDAVALLPVLEETSADVFTFADSHLAWRDVSATLDQVTAARTIARAFGSCSFEDPIAGLKSLNAYL
jgi:hypothetical protein